MDDLGQWAGTLAEAGKVRDGLAQKICELCVPALGVSGAGISIVSRGGTREILCSTDAASAHVEDLQFVMGDGPCVRAMQSDEPVLISDVAARAGQGSSWPEFMFSAAGKGVSALFAFPLRLGHVNVGALDLYRRTAGDLTADQLAGALMAADAAADSLLGLAPLAVQAAEDDTHHMQVHQATGMVMVQMDVPHEDALAMLRARAYATGVSLLHVSREVVDRRLRFSKEDQ
ncbi:MAG: GAF and ANTAR domain-containing protein [Actinomycetales bacterium]